MSDPQNYAFPFDPTGTALSNKIQDERQVISPPNWSDHYFVVPLAAPFFRESMVVRHHPSDTLLVEGVDYVCTHRFYDASLAVAKPVYGSITFYDKMLAGVIQFDYQTIGGAWTLPEAEILEILSNKLLNPRITTWEQVTELPFQFPTIDHEWNLDDMVGASEIVAKLEGIRQAILMGGSAGGGGDLVAHMSDFDNPHQVTKTQVGLSAVQNFSLATQSEAEVGTVNNKYMTPLRTKEAIAMQILTPFLDHVNNGSNPHNVTKTQVGLQFVQNLPLATTGDALAGTSHTVYMTPLRTKEMFQYLVGTSLEDHINNISNPHGTTKAQVGLGSVANYDIATQAQAQAGTVNNKYMTPLRVREAIEALTDYYTTTEIDAMLAGLGGGGGGTSAALFPVVTEAAESWTKIGTLIYPGGYDPFSEFVDTNPLRSVVFLMVGGQRIGQADPPVVRVSVSSITQEVQRIEQLSGDPLDLQFGTEFNESGGIHTLVVWVRNPTSRASMSIFPISAPTQWSFTTAAALVTVEPDTIGYVSPSKYFYGHDDLRSLNPGEIRFGRHDEDIEDSAGLLMEHVDVFEVFDIGMDPIHTSDNPPSEGANRQVRIIDAIHDFRMFRASENNNRDMYGNYVNEWTYDLTIPDNPEHCVQNVSTNNGLQVAVAPYASTNYQFEVLLESSSTGQGAIGVCCAHVRLSGKDHGIYLLRSPGGLAISSTGSDGSPPLPGGDIYRLVSLGYNLFQADALDLGSTNANLLWGDAVLNEDRVDVYDADFGGGWSAAGKTRVRVERNGSTMTITVSQFSETGDFNPLMDQVYTFSLYANRETAIMAEYPSSWGLCQYDAENATFRISPNQRPDGQAPFIVINHFAEAPSVQQSYRYNGQTFTTSDLKLNGRLVYSPVNGRLYQVNRNGLLRRLPVVPSWNQNVSILGAYEAPAD